MLQFSENGCVVAVLKFHLIVIIVFDPLDQPKSEFWIFYLCSKQFLDCFSRRSTVPNVIITI